MTETPQRQDLAPALPSGTAASSFHLPTSLDWFSLSMLLKNRTVIKPDQIKIVRNLEVLDIEVHFPERMADDPSGIERVD